MNKINLKHLSCALEIKRLGSASDAAHNAHISQSAITQGISKLESQLNIKLFERTNNGMYTTAVGQIFLSRVERAFGYLEVFANGLFEKNVKQRQTFLNHLTSRQLIALITVVETESYTQSAFKLSLTQPTLGKTIKDLEFAMGQSLFTRTPIGVIPSWRARQMAKFASLFFSEVEQGVEEVNEYNGKQSGTLKIGTLPLVRTEIIPKTVNAILLTFPNAKIEIFDGPYEEQLNALRHGQIDIIVGALRPASHIKDIVQTPLFDESLSLITRVAHPIMLASSESDHDLGQYQWIAPKAGTPTREAFNRLFEHSKWTPPQNIIECSSPVAIRGLLLNSDRIALLSASQVAMEIQQGLLMAKEIAHINTRREIGYSLRENWKATALQAHFIQLLNDYAS